MKTNLRYAGHIYKNCGPSGAQKEALQADTDFRKMATDEYGKVIGNMQDVFGQIQQQVGSIAAAGVGQQGWTPAETSARQGQVITQAAAANKQLQASIAEKGAMTSGGGPGLTTGATLATEAGAESNVLNKEAEMLQQNTAENDATGRENYWKATAVEGAIPGEEAKISSEAAQPVLGAQKNESDQANENQAASSSWMGLVGGLAQAGASAAAACWIAAEVYDGWGDPRVDSVRDWIFNVWAETSVVGALVAKIYLKFGERIARLVRKNQVLKAGFKRLFDIALRKSKRVH